MQPFHIETRVTYKDTDKMGVVYYANYFIWFEVCRTEYFRNKGYPYKRLEDKNIFLPVVDAHCEYKSSATYDDLIQIYLTDLTVKGVRLIFSYEIKNKETGELIARGYTTHVFIDNHRKPLKIPPEVREIIEN